MKNTAAHLSTVPVRFLGTPADRPAAEAAARAAAAAPASREKLPVTAIEVLVFSRTVGKVSYLLRDPEGRASRPVSAGRIAL